MSRTQVSPDPIIPTHRTKVVERPLGLKIFLGMFLLYGLYTRVTGHYKGNVRELALWKVILLTTLWTVVLVAQIVWCGLCVTYIVVMLQQIDVPAGLYTAVGMASTSFSAINSHIVFAMYRRKISDHFCQQIWLAIDRHISVRFARLAGRYGLVVALTCTAVTAFKCISHYQFNTYKLSDDIRNFTNNSHFVDVVTLVNNNEVSLYTIYNILVFNAKSICIGSFVLNCLLMNLHFQQLERINDKAIGYMSNKHFNKKVYYEFIVDAKQYHENLCQLVEDGNDLFSHLIFVWYADVTLALTFWLRALTGGSGPNVWYNLEMVGSFGLTIVIFLGLSLSGASINGKVTSTIPLPSNDDDDESDDSAAKGLMTKLSFLNYEKKISQSPPCFSGRGFFTISHGLVITIAGTVLTYTLVLYGL